MTPASMPPCSYASGIIVSASIVRIAPAAKVSTNATVFGDAPWNRLYPASDARPEIRVIPDQRSSSREAGQPAARSPAVDEIDSGRFEMNTAAR
jgi:hypothetical protein